MTWREVFDIHSRMGVYRHVMLPQEPVFPVTAANPGRAPRQQPIRAGLSDGSQSGRSSRKGTPFHQCSLTLSVSDISTQGPALLGLGLCVCLGSSSRMNITLLPLSQSHTSYTGASFRGNMHRHKTETYPQTQPDRWTVRSISILTMTSFWLWTPPQSS